MELEQSTPIAYKKGSLQGSVKAPEFNIKQQKKVEGHRPKRCEDKNEDKPNILSDKNDQTSSKKFTLIILIFYF